MSDQMLNILVVVLGALAVGVIGFFAGYFYCQQKMDDEAERARKESSKK